MKTLYVSFLLLLTFSITQAQWTELLNTNTSNPLYSVYFVDDYTGWAVGLNGTIINTTDGGSNWNLQLSSTTAALYSAHFVDSNTGWVVGDGGLILKTTNGGLIWLSQNSGTSNVLRSTYFVSPTVGYVVGNNGIMLKTTDGGTNWVVKNSSTASNLYNVYFYSSLAGYSGGSSNTIVKTTDGGESWYSSNIGSGGDQIRSFFFTSLDTGFAVGGYVNYGYINKTTDGGNTWTYQTNPTLPTSFFYSVKFISATTGWVCGYLNQIIKTTDGGSSWTLDATTYSGGYNWGLSFPSSNYGYCVGNNGTLTKYTNPSPSSIDLLTPNGGENWQVGSSQNNIAWISTNVANVKLEYTTNNGTSWIDITSVPASTGSYAWTIPNTPSTQCLVRVSDAINSNTNDISTNLFAISSIPINPCPGTPTVLYGGKTYNTVQIGDQCWLRENLDVGTMIQGSQNQTSNSVIEKYCYDNNPTNCETYGGLYQWDEAMQYVTTYGAKGICPTGWHIPTLSEFQTLSTTVGNDGNTLKAIGQGAGSGAGTNASGFSSLLAGSRRSDGYFYSLGFIAFIWSSEKVYSASAYFLGLNYDTGNIIFPDRDYRAFGFSVRCLRDEMIKSLNLNTPNGGENWQVGSEQIITWTSTDVTNVKLEYTTNNGTSWIDIVVSTPASSSSYSWTVPNTPTAQGRVRISDASNSSINDLSNNVFTILFEQFTEQTTTNLTGMRSSSVAWGDYDNDGDLDILLTGEILGGSGRVSKIYRNNGDNTFTDMTSIILTGVYSGSVAWGDYDNDGDLDILLTGYAETGYVSKIYRNEGNNTFTDMETIILTGVLQGSVAWGDYDNDGDLDILLTGHLPSGYRVSKIYRNEGNNTFTDMTSIILEAVEQSSVAWGDYDNDGDLDILLAGYGNIGRKLEIYRNEGNNTFTDMATIILTGVANSSVAWGDYDNDGDLDILSTGYIGSGVSKIYRNNGDNTFTDMTSIILTGVYSGSVAWGDYDNDGDLDILLTGWTGSLPISKIYKNNGDNSFTEQTSINLTGVRYSSVAWGDYDNDGDLDILLTGHSASSLISKIYRNNSIIANTPPSSPLNLDALVNADSVTFSWDKSTDTQTPQNGLKYNIVIGTTPGAIDIFSPMSDRSTGYRKVVQMGNTNHNNSWTIKGLPLGTYYWSVQAIDNNFAGSYFSEERSFTVNQPLVTLTSPNGGENWQVGSSQNITWTSANVTNAKLEYTTNNGTSWIQIIASTPATTGFFSWTVPSTPSTEWKIKISDVTDSSVFDISDNTFTISNTTSQLTVSVFDGWNMVSIPGLHPVNQNVLTWWSGKDPAAGVFKFTDGYQVVTTAEPRTGYWMKHTGDKTYNTGDEWPANGILNILHNALIGMAGWNMIGGYEYNAAVSGITTTPLGLQDSPVFGYSNGYQIVNYLIPGFGYWIKLSGAGLINLPNALAKETSILAEYIKEDWGKIIITDNSGKGYTLYTVKGKVNLDYYELPPSPFADMFDVRYGSGRLAEDLSSEVQSIDMQGVEYPIRVRTENVDIRLQDASGSGLNERLKSGEEITISNSSINKLMVSGDVIPDKYALYQNYPNPFNPSTKIEFSIPEDVNNVTLTIFNALGQKVAELVNSKLEAGKYSYVWNASEVATGLYIYELRTDKFISVKKMILLK